MADIFSNIQAPSSIPSTPVVQPAPGEFVKSDVKVVAEMQQKFHARVESLGILEEVASLEKNPVRNFAWKTFAILGFFRFGTDEASNLTEVVSKLRKWIEAVEPKIVAESAQNSQPKTTEITSKAA